MSTPKEKSLAGGWGWRLNEEVLHKRSFITRTSGGSQPGSHSQVVAELAYSQVQDTEPVAIPSSPQKAVPLDGLLLLLCIYSLLRQSKIAGSHSDKSCSPSETTWNVSIPEEFILSHSLVSQTLTEYPVGQAPGLALSVCVCARRHLTRNLEHGWDC